MGRVGGSGFWWRFEDASLVNWLVGGGLMGLAWAFGRGF